MQDFSALIKKLVALSEGAGEAEKGLQAIEAFEKEFGGEVTMKTFSPALNKWKQDLQSPAVQSPLDTGLEKVGILQKIGLLSKQKKNDPGFLILQKWQTLEAELTSTFTDKKHGRNLILDFMSEDENNVYLTQLTSWWEKFDQSTGQC